MIGIIGHPPIVAWPSHTYPSGRLVMVRSWVSASRAPCRMIIIDNVWINETIRSLVMHS
jgi:hypothetical protein